MLTFSKRAAKLRLCSWQKKKKGGWEGEREVSFVASKCFHANKILLYK